MPSFQRRASAHLPPCLGTKTKALATSAIIQGYAEGAALPVVAENVGSIDEIA
jgi:hypothetical protein